MSPTRSRAGALLGLCALLASLSAHAAAEASDDSGRVLRLAAPARRIVSLAPHATELLYDVGAGKALVGAVQYSDYPAAARKLPRVGRAGALDLERLLALRPDLVIAWRSGNVAAQVARIERLGIPVFFSEPRRLADIPRDLRALGRLSGHAAQGERAAAAFEARRAALERRYGGRAPLRGLYQIWPQPLMTVSGEHLISRIMALCGVKNVFAGLSALVPRIGVEAVLAADPQIILASPPPAQGERWKRAWRRWSDLAAVRAGNLFTLDPDLTHRPTPRILDGAARLCRDAQQARQRLGMAPLR